MMKDPGARSVKSAYGPRLVQNWDDYTFRQCVLAGYGFDLYRLIMQQRTKPFAFLDIGANIGVYSLIASQAPSCSSVYSVEPNPFVFEQLVENARINKANIEAHNIAIGSEAGTQKLYYSTDHTGRANLRGKGEMTVDIAVKNYEFLDEIAGSSGDRFFLKCDVEGFEPIVMAEIAKSKIAEKVDEIFIEVIEGRLTQAGIRDIFDVARTLGLEEVFRVGDKSHFDIYFKRKKG
jgi:FkbM family methyltransferase